MIRRSYLPTIGLVVIALSIAGWALFSRCPNGQVKSGLICLASSQTNSPPSPNTPTSTAKTPQPTKKMPEDLAQRFSRGDRILFRGDGNSDRDAGVDRFASGNYQRAITDFTRAVASSRNDPEAQIYLNNAISRSKGKPYTLAVVVPVDNRVDVAKEILRGVADAQTRFNQSDGKDNRLLEILIVNDGNDQGIAAGIAAQLAGMPDVLGVVGHNSSDASLAALPKYEEAGLAMISPTSTSTQLKGDTFFRTVPSDSASGQQLANYVANQLNVRQVVIFYDSKSRYSQSLQQAFASSFSQSKGKVVRLIDFAEPNLNGEAEIKQSATEAQTALLFPSTQTVPRAVSIARANATLPEGQQLRLLGGDALYDNRTLINGGEAIRGLVLAVPWFANTPYAERANSHWGGRINWRTASSYDATQALIQTLSKRSSRSQVLQGLRSLQLTKLDTSGNPLRFESSGDRAVEPLLVQAVKGGNRPIGSDFGFALIQ